MSASVIHFDLTQAPGLPAEWGDPSLAKRIAALRATALRGLSVDLRPYHRDHAEALRQLRNQPHNRAMLAQPEPLTTVQQSTWTDAYLDRTDDLCWTLFTPAGAFAGSTSLYDITADRAETGRLVLDEAAARLSPLLAETVLSVAWLGLQWLGLREIVARIQPANAKMITMHRRLGFTEIGPSEIRGAPYLAFALTAADFDLGPHRRLLEHWRQHHPRA